MGVDEAVLAHVGRDASPPTLRLWQWTDRALVLGSHQSVANEVDRDAAAELGFTVARRLSGGGTMICEPGRTITYSLVAPEALVAGMSFIDSFEFLDAWAVQALRELGVPAGYRPVNDIVSPRGKIGGAAQARRRRTVLHHTTIAHSMDVSIVRRLIRIGRGRVVERGIRSAEKEVSPLDWFTERGVDAVVEALGSAFAHGKRCRLGPLSASELAQAEALATEKYATDAWIGRLG